MSGAEEDLNCLLEINQLLLQLAEEQAWDKFENLLPMANQIEERLDVEELIKQATPETADKVHEVRTLNARLIALATQHCDEMGGVIAEVNKRAKAQHLYQDTRNS